jgi:hypothetical protein
MILGFFFCKILLTILPLLLRSNRITSPDALYHIRALTSQIDLLVRRFSYYQYTPDCIPYQSAQKIAPDFGKIKKQGRIMAPALKSAILHF